MNATTEFGVLILINRSYLSPTKEGVTSLLETPNCIVETESGNFAAIWTKRHCTCLRRSAIDGKNQKWNVGCPNYFADCIVTTRNTYVLRE